MGSSQSKKSKDSQSKKSKDSQPKWFLPVVIIVPFTVILILIYIGFVLYERQQYTKSMEVVLGQKDQFLNLFSQWKDLKASKDGLKEDMLDLVKKGYPNSAMSFEELAAELDLVVQKKLCSGHIYENSESPTIKEYCKTEQLNITH